MLVVAVSFKKKTVVANGDHVYWDLLSPAGGPRLGASAEEHRNVFILSRSSLVFGIIFFFQAEDGIRDGRVTGVQTCALPISARRGAHQLAHRLRVGGEKAR